MKNIAYDWAYRLLYKQFIYIYIYTCDIHINDLYFIFLLYTYNWHYRHAFRNIIIIIHIHGMCKYYTLHRLFFSSERHYCKHNSIITVNILRYGSINTIIHHYLSEAYCTTYTYVIKYV